PLFEKMNLLASGAPAGLTVDTRFNGTRLDPGVTGSIEGITLSNLTVGSLTRGFIGGIAEELARLYDELLHRSGSAPAYLVGSGNAVRRNAVLRVELERRIGLPLRVPLESEEAALGAALCAAVGAGAYSSLADAGAMIAYEP
ncbi:MAG TPA: FGGY-family carbohydrate kinase, partial [Spirochaetia bacterium]|nr:FGGY-family carbohydrate kinase [Spirochaetia bacterium]